MEPGKASRSAMGSGLLRTAGFSRVEMFDATALRARYLPSRADLRLPASTVIAVATV